MLYETLRNNASLIDANKMRSMNVEQAAAKTKKDVQSVAWQAAENDAALKTQLEALLRDFAGSVDTELR